MAQFRPYLFCRSFTVVTDHHALCSPSSLKDPVGHLSRFALRLQEYTITVIQKCGKRHADADSLSGHPLPLDDLRDIDCDVIEYPNLVLSYLLFIDEEQRREPALRTLIDELSRGTPTHSSFRNGLRNKVLYQRNFRQPWFVLLP